PPSKGRAAGRPPRPRTGHFRYLSSTVQYASSRNAFHDWYFGLPRRIVMAGLRLGFTGRRMRRMPAWSGARPPLRALQRTQAQTRFVHELSPPWTRGTTWSSVSSFVEYFLPQYWQRLPSRA